MLSPAAPVSLSNASTGAFGATVSVITALLSTSWLSSEVGSSSAVCSWAAVCSSTTTAIGGCSSIGFVATGAACVVTTTCSMPSTLAFISALSVSAVGSIPADVTAIFTSTAVPATSDKLSEIACATWTTSRWLNELKTSAFSSRTSARSPWTMLGALSPLENTILSKLSSRL